MKRSLLILAMAAGVGVAASSARAHHSHPYFYDQCRTVTIEGRVDSVDWKDPHTWIVVRVDEGAVYTVDWNALTALTRRGEIGPAQASLVSGTRITVTGNPIRTLAQIREHFQDYNYEVNPNTLDPRQIRRVDDSWTWAASPLSKPPDCTGK
jgi:hypothetical protein